MADYISKFSGVEIDKAVAYYNAIQLAGRKIIEVSVVEDKWSGDAAPYSLTITLKGAANIVGSTTKIYSPTVYFIDSNGNRWEVDYNYKYNQTSSVGTIVCNSNQKIAGTVVIMGVMSDNTVAETTTA